MLYSVFQTKYHKADKLASPTYIYTCVPYIHIEYTYQHTLDDFWHCSWPIEMNLCASVTIDVLTINITKHSVRHI